MVKRGDGSGGGGRHQIGTGLVQMLETLERKMLGNFTAPIFGIMNCMLLPAAGAGVKFKGLFPYYVISYNKQGSFQMITKDYSKGPRVVGKDYVLWKIQSMQESATMPHAHVFCCTPQC